MSLEIRTRRLLLRPGRLEDFQPFAAMNEDPRVMEFFPAVLHRGGSMRLLLKYKSVLRKHVLYRIKSKLRLLLLRLGESSAQRTIQVDRIRQPQQLRLHQRLFGIEQFTLGVQHIQIAGDTVLVACLCE